MTRYIYVCALALLICAMPFSKTHAETVLRTGSTVSITTGQVVQGNYYVSVGPTGKTDMSGTVQGDMYAFGGSVLVNGEVDADVGILAGTAQVLAPVKGDVRVVAGDTTISGDVQGDVFVMGGSLAVLSTAHVLGNIYFFGGDMTVAGPVDGSIFGSADKVRIDSVISHDVQMTATSNLAFGDNADIKGNVAYTSLVPLVRGQNAMIEGSITKSVPPTVSIRTQLSIILIPLFVLLFASLILFLFFKQQMQALLVTIDTSFRRSLLIGMATVFVGPVIGILLLVSILGIWIGAITVLGVLVLIAMAIPLVSIVLGAFTMRLYTKKLSANIATIVLGTLLLSLVLMVPLLGILIILVVLMVIVGSLVHAIYQRRAP